MAAVLPLAARELEFFERLNDARDAGDPPGPQVEGAQRDEAPRRCPTDASSAFPWLSAVLSEREPPNNFLPGIRNDGVHRFAHRLLDARRVNARSMVRAKSGSLQRRVRVGTPPRAKESDAVVLRGRHAALVILKSGLPLGRSLDGLLAFVVRRFPLTAPMFAVVVTADDVPEYDDALGRAHRALRAFLLPYGYRASDDVLRAAAAVIEAECWPPWWSTLVGDNKRIALEHVARLERSLRELRDAAARATVPSSTALFRDDTARSTLNELLLAFLSEVVEVRLDRVPADLRIAIGDLLRVVPKVRFPTGVATQAPAKEPLVLTSQQNISPWY